MSKKIEITNNGVVIEEGKIERVEMTLKELAMMTNIPEGTIRAWIMKPMDGVPYSISNINYPNLVNKLLKYIPEFTKQYGFQAKDIILVRAERSTKNWLTIEDLIKLEPGVRLTMHNYSLKTELTYCGQMYDTTVYPNELVRIFKTKKDEYKAYSVNDLSKENIKFEQE